MTSSAIQAAFIFLVLHLGVHKPCPLPNVIWSSPFIISECQKYARPDDQALSCYDPDRVMIILPDGWSEYSHSDEALLYHEMDRHVEQVCLGRRFTEDEPRTVLQAEGFAP
jgi:hypothetical protein